MVKLPLSMLWPFRSSVTVLTLSIVPRMSAPFMLASLITVTVSPSTALFSAVVRST